MKSNELRIGNYVNCNGEPCRVYQIEHRYKTNYRINDINIDERTIEDAFTPIPLTPELLEKCGFEIEDPKYGVSFRINDKFIIRRCNFSEYPAEKKFDDFGFSFELSTEKDWANVIDRVIYLHQLQNIISALTGTELTITL